MKQLNGETDSDFVVDFENWPAFSLFLDLQTQWTFAGMTAIRVGLDYSKLHAVMQMRGVRRTSAMFERVRWIEHGAIAGLNETSLEDLFRHGQ